MIIIIPIIIIPIIVILIIIIPIYVVIFHYRLNDSDSLMSLEEARQQSETVSNNQTHLSIVMQVGFVTLGGRCMVQPL